MKTMPQHSGRQLFSTLLVLCCECPGFSPETTAPTHRASEPVQNTAAVYNYDDKNYFLHKRDYITFESMQSKIRLLSVTFVRPTQGVETYSNISLPFCTLAILRPPCQI